LNWDFKFLGALIGTAITLACSREEVGAIVLVYANHGTAGGLGAAQGFLRGSDFTQWMLTCALSERKFLVVLDACYSTVFATAALDHTKRELEQIQQMSKAAWIESNVGFITSAKGVCARSTSMISKDPDLVMSFGETPRGAEWVNGFFTRSSMFLRQFNWMLTYGFQTWHPKLTVREFVRRMNLRRFAEGHGFHASLVAGEGFGSSEFKSFFQIQPLGPPNPAAAVPGWPEITIGGLIPAARVGHLYDDVEQLEEEDGEEEERVMEEEVVGQDVPDLEAAVKLGTVSYLLIPIERVGSVVRRAGPAVLSSQANVSAELLHKLSVSHSSAHDEEEDEMEPRRPERLQPGHLLIEVIGRLAKGKIREGRSAATLESCSKLRSYLETLDVWVPVSASDSLARLSRLRSEFDSDATFERFLDEMRARALVTWPEFAAVYSTARVPIPDIPEDDE
jgi:hypothetical protein